MRRKPASCPFPEEIGGCRSFPPCANAAARVLILGSMPGEESLRRQQYYAFPRNAFWRIMGELCGFPPPAAPGGAGGAADPFAAVAALPYRQRLRAIQARGVALWDVLAACERDGSLDAAIRRPRPNDVPGLLRACPRVALVCCNGGAAGRYLRRFFPAIAARAVVLPSTSPAAAMFPYAEKLARWRAALAPALAPARRESQ